MLAGMSTDYYTRLERGNLAGVSASVLDALARALRLDEAERAHLFDLAATASGPGPDGTRRARQPQPRQAAPLLEPNSRAGGRAARPGQHQRSCLRPQ